jgi:hypothetical protein
MSVVLSEIIPTKFERKTAVFFNWTDLPFTHTWDKEPFSFKPGERVKMDIALCYHFARHLTNHYFNEKKLNPQDQGMYRECFEKCVLNVEDTDQSNIARSMVRMDEEAPAKEASVSPGELPPNDPIGELKPKRGRPKKVEPATFQE